MSNQGRSTYQASLDTSSYFEDNTSEQITEAKVRDSLTNLSDSVLFKKDDPFLRIVTASTGTEPDYVITLTNLYSGAYSELMPILFPAHATNTGAATININSLGAKNLRRPDGTATQAGDVVIGQLYIINYDSGNDEFLIVPGFGGGTALADNSLLLASGTITSAQVLSANSSQVELIAAPGAGSFIVVHSSFCSLDYNSVAYATNTDSRIRYDNNTTILSNTTALLTSISDIVRFTTTSPLAIPINSAVQYFVASGDPTAGNSDVKYKIWYTIETI